jgi:acid phosphatase (class A)
MLTCLLFLLSLSPLNVFALPYDIDPGSLSLGAPPAPDSEVGKRDYLTVKNWQSTRTHEQCHAAAAQSHKKLPLAFFADGLLPKSALAAFNPTIDKWMQLSMQVTQPFQARFNRLRPFQLYPDLQPCVDRPATQSYPSSHATTGMLVALLLSEISPEKSAGFRQVGLQIGQNRVIGGAHFPSDVAAGQALGEQLWKQIRVHPVFLQEARELQKTLKAQAKSF